MRRFFVFLLAVCLCLSLMPATAASAAAEVWDGTVDISWYDAEKDTFWLSTPAQLAGLAALVNGMTDPTCPKIIGDTSLLQSIPVSDFTLVGAGGGNVNDTVYTSGIDFSYKTVYLTADMDMGGRYDSASATWSGPNWTPIGGKFPMLPHEVAGDCLTLDTRFNGVLDGQGHAIRNLYCDRYADKGFPYSMAIGVVGYLGGDGGVKDNQDAVKAFEDGWQPAVRNLVLASGSVRGRRMVGGIVGRVDETSNGVCIENCANYASVHSTDAKGVGGIVGSAWGKGTIRGCYNVGTVSTTYSSPAGGIVGTEGGMDIYCCYNAGRITSNGRSRGRAIGSHDTGSYTVANCLYLEGCGDDPDNPAFYMGNSKHISVSVTGMDEAALKSEAALAVLNTDGVVFAPDINGINGGYPVLWFQNGTDDRAFAVTVGGSRGGSVSADCGTAAAYGQSVHLSCVPAAGFTLAYYTVNGSPISSDVFTVTGDSVVSAVFKSRRTVRLYSAESPDFYACISTDGNPLRSGDAVTEEEVLTVSVYGYDDAVPEDMNLEYTDAYAVELSGTVQNSDGTYTVTGTCDVTVSIRRKTRPKEWISLADTDWYDQYPRQSSYTLETPEQLAGLAKLVNVRGVSFEGVTIVLGRDISLDNTDGTVGVRSWTPIGSNASKSFCGRFDGQGHAIYDMTLQAGSSYAALFGCCKNAQIENVSVYGTVESSAPAAYAAGIAAWFSGGSIRACTNYCTITVSGTHAGGIAAMIRDGAAVTDCFNCGSISAASGLGGIVGVSDSGEDVIERCANFGALTSTGNSTYGTGGIAGRLAGCMCGCQNAGDVTGTDRYTGGLAGYATTKNHSTILCSASCASVRSSNAMATAALGGIVGYAQFLRMGNAENRGTVTPEPGFVSGHCGAEVGRTGQTPVTALHDDAEIPSYSAPEARSFVREAKSSYTVRFLADGTEVASRVFRTGAAAVQAPAVPEKEGYTGSWEPYTLGDRDLIVEAVYRPKLVQGGDVITRDGTYFVAWCSTGSIRIEENVRAELVGTCGGQTGFDNLSLSVGKNAALTLTDMVLSGENILLEMAGNNTLTLSGCSALTSRAETEGLPTAIVGTLRVNGDGRLDLTAGKKNPALFVEPGSTVTLTGGCVTVEKDTLLGTEGGAFYANGARLVIDGGEFRGHTSSDNVAVISADSVTLNAGTLLAQAEKSPLAIEAAVYANGGTLQVSGHTGNYTTDDIAYEGAEACAAFSGSASPGAGTPFTDLPVTARWYDAACRCYADGLFRGVSATEFAPDTAMTRAMFVTVLYRMAGQPAADGDTPFTDLTQDWYRSAVSWAVANGITGGTSETTFSPDMLVTREQAAVFLFRFARNAGDLVHLVPLAEPSDYGTPSDWAAAECYWAINCGLFSGTADALKAPGDAAPRHMLASALDAYRTLVQSDG